MNIKEIISAWVNKAYGSEEIYEIAKERREVCDNCTENINILGIDTCKKCLCPLAAKTFTEENSCPLNKWRR